MKSITILDLFCGAGGFAYGFTLASSKFDVILAIDIDKRVIKSYQKNLPGTKVISQDITTLHANDILEILNYSTPDIIIASPPCEAFSSANVNRKKNHY